MDSPPGEQFRTRIDEAGATPALGVYDALSATIAEQAGADLIYMSGSSVSTSVHGGPDVGLTTMTEMVRRARGIVGAVEVPVFADADTGYGNPINVRRTVEEFERAQVGGLHLEDQTFPKRCGHFQGKSVISADEMIAKIHAAVDARNRGSFQIIARTDVRAIEGLDSAIERGRRYVEAGADVIFVEAPNSREELHKIGREIEAPLVANMTEGGETPLFSCEELGEMGFDLVLFPATGFKAVCKTLGEVYDTIVTEGTQRHIMDHLVDWQGRNDITGLADIHELEARYESGSR